MILFVRNVLFSFNYQLAHRCCCLLVTAGFACAFYIAAKSSPSLAIMIEFGRNIAAGTAGAFVSLLINLDRSSSD